MARAGDQPVEDHRHRSKRYGSVIALIAYCFVMFLGSSLLYVIHPSAIRTLLDSLHPKAGAKNVSSTSTLNIRQFEEGVHYRPSSRKMKKKRKGDKKEALENTSTITKDYSSRSCEHLSKYTIKHQRENQCAFARTCNDG
ncbi:MAG: hypothetical protein ACRDL7_12575, partial [Gaiellaceae bacterium]